MSDKDKYTDLTLEKEMDDYERYKAGRELFNSFSAEVNLILRDAVPMVEDFLEIMNKLKWGKDECKGQIYRLNPKEKRACLIAKRKEAALTHYDLHKDKYLILITRELLEDNDLYTLKTPRQKPRDFKVKLLSKIIQHKSTKTIPVRTLRQILQHLL